MKTPTRRGSWRNVAPGQYVKNIGTYGNVEFGATARVSFVPFPTCEILDANGVHVAIPTPADAKKFIAAAKKAYSKDTKAAAAKAALPRETPPPKLPKWKPPSQTMYGLTTVSDDPYRSLPPHKKRSIEPKLVKSKSQRGVSIGVDAMKKLTQAQKLEAEIKTLRGRLSVIGPRPSPEKSKLNAEIRTRQATIRKLLPKKYRTPKQFAAAIRKTYEEEVSIKREPSTSVHADSRTRTMRAIGKEYLE